MRREVVQDFLNLPGIAGVALMDGRSRPYFCGVDQSLNFQQKEALAQGIQQVVETTPSGFESFEFQFTGHQVYIYKLNHGIILLVLTSNSLVSQTYLRAIELLKKELQDDAANTIATFRLLAGNVTLSNQNYWKRRTEPPPPVEPLFSVSSTLPTPQPQTHNSSSAKIQNRDQNDSQQSEPTPKDKISEDKIIALDAFLQPDPSVQLNTSKLEIQPPVNLKDLLIALNRLSQFTTQYLGTTVITNYWKSTRPDIEWLSNFQIDRSAQFTLSNSTLLNNAQIINTEQHQWVQDWVAAFIQRCSKVIRDFPSIIEHRALDDYQKALLIPSKIS